MDNSGNLESLVDIWITGIESGPDSEYVQENWSVFERVLLMNGKPNELWQFIVMVYPRLNSQRNKAVFAAGPLEDLVSTHGEQYLGKIEELARKDEEFRYLLGGVWQANTPAHIWSRFEKIRGKSWDDDE